MLRIKNNWFATLEGVQNADKKQKEVFNCWHVEDRNKNNILHYFDQFIGFTENFETPIYVTFTTTPFLFVA